MAFGGVEFFAEVGYDVVVDGVGLAVEFDAQTLRLADLDGG